MNKEKAINISVNLRVNKKKGYLLSEEEREAEIFVYENKLEDEVSKRIELLRPLKEERACDRLFEIIKEASIWKLGKNNEELEEIKKVLKEHDIYYVSRVYLYKQLIQLPKFQKLTDDEKLIIAMKLGALDFSDL